uniref:Uncharacterized protein n=1 Tax=Leptobrachium leishanense TaxID=445787 RepID=A0A8C5P6W6_9ANUR
SHFKALAGSGKCQCCRVGGKTLSKMQSIPPPPHTSQGYFYRGQSHCSHPSRAKWYPWIATAPLKSPPNKDT